ncbi:MAG: prepilin peptidase [Actinomycetota bacterium]
MGPWVIAGSAFIGLLIGSFLNVVVYRIPAGLAVVRPPSSCPRCGHLIRSRDNIPVASWFLLRGECRDCGEPISPRYPLVEAGTAILFGVTGWLIGPVWVLPAYLWFVGVTLALALVDIDHRRIPNRILYPGTIVATVLLAGGAVADGSVGALWRALAGGGAYFGFLLVLALVARGGFGFGDVKLGFLLGEFLGYRSWGALLVGGFMAFLVGGLLAALLLAARRAGRKDAIPFGPALVIGCYVAIAAGEAILDWYLR